MSSGFSIGQEGVATLVKRSSDAVVLILTSDSNGPETAVGSGFSVSADGEIVTNFHIVEGAHSVVVKLPTGAVVPVSGVLAWNPDRDLAILKVSGKNLPFLTLENDDTLQAGDHVVAIGSPLGLEGTLSDGIVSSIRESDGKKWIQTTAPASHSNSGGPLVDMRGKVVGVMTWISKQGQNLNFAIPSDDVKFLLSNQGELTSIAAVGESRSGQHLQSSIDCSPLPKGKSLYLITIDDRRDEQLGCGSVVQILDRGEGLSRIRTAGGQEGWVQSLFIK